MVNTGQEILTCIIACSSSSLINKSVATAAIINNKSLRQNIFPVIFPLVLQQIKSLQNKTLRQALNNNQNFFGTYY
jgi:hypothetical protein